MSEPQPGLSWMNGTAGDFFVSLYVVHNPDVVGLPAPWAAGVRSRLPDRMQMILRDTTKFLIAPLPWLAALPEPRSAQSALAALDATPVDERLAALVLNPWDRCDAEDVLKRILEQRSWDEEDADIVRKSCEKGGLRVSRKDTASWLSWWTKPEEFGRLFLDALHAYYDVFFREEERRIQGTLRGALDDAQKRSEHSNVSDLLERLSQGLRFQSFSRAEEIVLSPSYWCTPLIVEGRIGQGRQLILFGARPEDASLVPGGTVPDALSQGLGALSDGTRLRMLQALAQERLTQAEIARKLRLRAPTITHHLRVLRLAGLVALDFSVKEEKRYSLRRDRPQEIFKGLSTFLNNGADSTTLPPRNPRS